MKKILSVPELPMPIHVALLIARIAIASLMLVHGVPKMMSLFSGDPVQFPGVMGMGSELSLTMAVFAEVLCSVLILFGFATRLAVIPLIVTMVIAVFYIHGNDPFTKQELGVHYLLVYAMLLITGSGNYSLDKVFLKKSN